MFRGLVFLKLFTPVFLLMLIKGKYNLTSCSESVSFAHNSTQVKDRLNFYPSSVWHPLGIKHWVGVALIYWATLFSGVTGADSFF